MDTVLLTADEHNTTVTVTTPRAPGPGLACTLFRIFLGISFGVNVLLVLVTLYLYFRRKARRSRTPHRELPHPDHINPQGDDNVEDRGTGGSSATSGTGGVRRRSRVESVFPKDEGYISPVDILRLVDAFKSISQSRSAPDPEQDYMITSEEPIEPRIYEEVWQDVAFAGSHQMRSSIGKVISTAPIEPDVTEDLTHEMIEERILAMEGIIWETPLTECSTTAASTGRELTGTNDDQCTAVITGDLTHAPQDEVPTVTEDSRLELSVPENIPPSDIVAKADVRLSVSGCRDNEDVLCSDLSPTDTDQAHRAPGSAETRYGPAKNIDLLQQQLADNSRDSVITREDNGCDGETTL